MNKEAYGYGMAKTFTTYVMNGPYIDIIQPVDSGEKVGMVKQLAITAAAPSVGETKIKSFLIDNMLVVPLKYFKPEQISAFTKVFVCGDWIGCTKLSTDFYQSDNIKSLLAGIDYVVDFDEKAQEIYFWPRWTSTNF